MNILVCCEESQAITKRCFEKGYNVFSCDLQSCSGGLPGRHIKGDCLPLCPTNLLLSPNNGYTCDEAKKFNFTQVFAHGSVQRSKTFEGVAEAIVTQWCDYVNSLL